MDPNIDWANQCTLAFHRKFLHFVAQENVDKQMLTWFVDQAIKHCMDSYAHLVPRQDINATRDWIRAWMVKSDVVLTQEFLNSEEMDPFLTPIFFVRQIVRHGDKHRIPAQLMPQWAKFRNTYSVWLPRLGP